MPPEAPKKKRKGGRLAFRIFLILLISLLLGGSLYMLNAKRLVRNAMPMPFGVGFSVVLSGSMEPTLSVDDLVIVRAAEHYEVGDVVVYQSGQSLVIHRIVEIDDTAVVTKGDANNIEDSPVAVTEIKGRMVGVIPGVGRAVHFLQSPLGIILILALAVFLLNRSWSKEKASDEKSLDALKEEIRRLKALEEQKLQSEQFASESEQSVETAVKRDSAEKNEAKTEEIKEEPDETDEKTKTEAPPTEEGTAPRDEE